MREQTLFTIKSTHRKKRQGSDLSANELTRQVLAWARFRGYFATRINNMGVYDQKRGCYRKSHTRPGFPDIVIIGPFGRFYGVEVKSGRDTQSDAQMQCEAEIRASGGVYIICRQLADVKEAFSNTNNIFLTKN